MPSTVEPRISRGLRDLLPDQMLARQSMIDTIRRVYELYGFVPLSTPAIEYLDVLSGSAGQEAQQSIFRVSNPENEALGLRFDLTVPLARVIAQYPHLPRPFRRYQVSPVWRADKPDRGRFREFTQFDLDSVGTESDVADTEIIAGMCDSLEALDVGRSLVRFSSRAMLNLLLEYAGISSEQGVDVVERISNHLYALGYGDDRVALDLSIARGLAYYTGPVFEAILLDAPQFGSVFGGGRYDDLVMRFLGERIPAVGASMGVDRLLAALESLKKSGSRRATARVLVTVMDRSLIDDYLQMTWELRRAG